MATKTFTFLKKCYRASYFKMASTFNQKWKGNPFSIEIFKQIYLSMWIFLQKQYKNASFGPTFSYYKVPHWVTPWGMVSAHKKVLKSTNGATPPPMEKPVRYIKNDLIDGPYQYSKNKDPLAGSLCKTPTWFYLFQFAGLKVLKMEK